jgi:membrane associated rhomboid family serine protease
MERAPSQPVPYRPMGPPPSIQQQVLERLRAGFRSTPPITTALVVIISLVHLSVGLDDWLVGRALFDGRTAGLYDVLLGARSEQGLMLWGANHVEAVSRGELWRLPASVFLHADLLHIFLNMLALFGLGRLCEAVYGPWRFLTLFLLTGLCGALLSWLGRAPILTDAEVASMSVGASGAVFGLMGAGVVFGRRFRAVLPGPVRQIFWRGLMPWIVLNIFIGITVPRIDNLGHMGGLFSGALLALVLGSPVIPGAEGRRRGTVTLAFAMMIVLGWTFGSMILNRLGF